MTASNVRSLGATAAMLTFLAGCQSAPTRLYTLYAVAPPAVTNTYAGAPIRLDAVHFPAALDRIEVVHDVAPGQLKLSDSDHWSAPLGEVARQALSGDLVARLPEGKILFPHLPKPDGALGLDVDVLEFTALTGGVSLEASWVVTANGQNAPLKRGTARLRADLANTDSAAIAQALSTLLAQLADRIVADL